MTQLLGKKIRDPLETLGLLSKFDSELRRVREPLDKFWKQHQEKLTDVRTMTAAHQEADSISASGTNSSTEHHFTSSRRNQHKLRGAGDYGQSDFRI